MSNSCTCQAIVYDLRKFHGENAMYTANVCVRIGFMAHTDSVGQGQPIYTWDWLQFWGFAILALNVLTSS